MMHDFLSSANHPRAALVRFLACEAAQDNVEYALVGALIALFAVVSIRGVSDQIANVYGLLGSKITTDIPGSINAISNSVTSRI